MYVPVLKNRSVEMDVLTNLLEIPLSSKVLPMIEIIQERLQSNSKTDFIEDLFEIMNSKEVNFPFMVDIIKMNVPNSVTQPVKDFLTQVNRKHEYYLDILKRLKGVSGAIPVISYNPISYDKATIQKDEEILRKHFDRLAFRINSNSFNDVFSEVQKVIRQQDFLILDIDTASHINPALKRKYIEIEKHKKAIRYTSIILNSTKAKEVTNLGLDDGEPIYSIDNSLRDAYKSMHHFDGFADYACISNELPSSGGTISPAGIYYSYEYNYFVGYRRNRDLAEFEDYIAPKIVESDYWKEYTEEHHERCPGCKLIYNIYQGSEKGKSQAKWKGITMFHYIYALDELLDSGL